MTVLSSNGDKRLQTLIELHHILMEQVLERFAKQSCQVNIND